MRIEAVVGDITTEKVDAIVNAANSTLLGGKGVDGAIHRAAGPRLLDACQKVRDTELPDGLPVGRAVATPGFDLPAVWVIHTVGPNLHAGEDDPALLRACFDSSLELAIQLGCAGIALPAVSAGVYGGPIAQVAEIVWQLRGEAGGRQVGSARIGLVETMGGGVSVLDGNACVVAVLEGP